MRVCSRMIPASSCGAVSFSATAMCSASFRSSLSTKKGEWYPAVVDVTQVLDCQEADAFERMCRAQGATVVSGLLAVNGIALHEMGAADVVRTVMPTVTPSYR